MLTPSAETPGVRTAGIRRAAGASRLGLAVASLASAGTLAVAFIGLGGPPAPVAETNLAVADTTIADAAAPQVVVKTIYVQLAAPTPAPTAAPIAAAPKAVSRVATRVVTSQSGSAGTEGDEQEGDD